MQLVLLSFNISIDWDGPNKVEAALFEGKLITPPRDKQIS